MRLPDVIKGYRGTAGASLKTYLKTTIRRDVMDAIRRERREPINSRSGENIVVGIESNSAEGDGPVARIAADAAFRADVIAYSEEKSNQRERPDWFDGGPIGAMESLLTDGQIQVVRLCHISGMTQERAAKELGITRGAVKSRLAKADAKLRKHLGK